jgi:regulator of sigma E protease
VQETRDSILQVYLTLSRLIEGSVPVNGVVGPVGMFQMGTKVASQGMDYLLWFLAIISANLAVVNFLPIPVVDGGHFLFLTIEKLRGKPVPDRIIAMATWCGLALIGFVFVAVTCQDILRMLTVH